MYQSESPGQKSGQKASHSSGSQGKRLLERKAWQSIVRSIAIQFLIATLFGMREAQSRAVNQQKLRVHTWFPVFGTMTQIRLDWK